MSKRLFVAMSTAGVLAITTSLASPRVQSSKAVGFGKTPALTEIVVPASVRATALREVPRRSRPAAVKLNTVPLQMDPVIQGGPVISNMPAPLISFDGLHNLDSVAPSDCNGDVGPNHYVEMVNMHFCIYDKDTGSALVEPMLMSQLFAAAGFPAPASTVDNGDPIVLYDSQADRWMISQFIVTVTPCHEVIGISQTPDPTGPWFLYDFEMPNDLMNDYPKFGVWPDAYYMTDNQFGLASADGVGVFAFDRVKMLAGDPDASYQYVNLFDVNPNYWALLPADLDGFPPPSGTPCYFAMLDNGYVDSFPSARIWEFSVDWGNPSNSTFGLNGLPNQTIPVAEFNSEFSGGRNVIPQKGTTQKLDSIGDLLMYRLQYRNFGDREALTVCHTVNVGDNRAGIRYYIFERSLPAGTNFVVAEQATYAPDDGNSRWMGSAALDGAGNLAVGFSISGTNLYPSIRYAGRMHDDPPGGLWQGEASLIEGTASQTGVNRWGDYSMMAVDPTDESTFWYNAQYTAGSWNWKTRIGSFVMESSNLGYVTGFVTNSLTGSPIEGADVHWTEQSGFCKTAADGSFRIIAAPGGRPLATTAPFYYDSVTTTVEVVAGATSHVDFAMMPIGLYLSPQSDAVASSEQGRAFQPQTFTYTVSNASLSSLSWTATCSVVWLDISPSAGVLAPFSATNMVCSLNQEAGFLPVGTTTGLLNVAATAGAENITAQRAIRLTLSGSLPILGYWDFEEGLPAGWIIDGAGWSFDDPRARGNRTGGTGVFAIVDSDYAGAVPIVSSLITDVHNLTGITNVSLSFKSDFLHYPGDLARVDYSLSGTNGPWLAAWTALDVSLRGPRTLSVTMPPAVNGSGNVAFRFYYEGYYAWWWEVDEVCLFGVVSSEVMSVEPITIWQETCHSGESLSVFRRYRVSATDTGSVECAVIAPDWIDCTPAMVSLQSGESAVITAAVSAVSSSLANGIYTESLRFHDSLSSNTVYRTVALTVIEPLIISPSTSYSASGLEGGPFDPAETAYSISNASSNAVAWSAASEADWLAFDTPSGILPAGSTTSVTVSAIASVLTNAGLHTADITFSNLTVASSQTRSASIDVIEITGSLGVFDSIAVTNDLYMPFGVVTGQTPRVEQITIANTGENARNLVVANIFFGYYLNTFEGTNAIDWSVGDGNWSVSNSAYHAQSDWAEFMFSRLEQMSWSNVWVESTVSLSTTNMGSHGIGVRASPDVTIAGSGSAYLFLITKHETGLYYALFRQKNGSISALQGWTLSSAIKSTENTLAVNVEGGDLRCYINGTLVWEGTDPDPLPAGSILLSANSIPTQPCVYAYESVSVGPSRERGIGLGRKQTYYNALPLDGDITGPFSKRLQAQAFSLEALAPVANGVTWPIYEASSTSQPPFTLSGLPALPITLAPGASFTVDVTYTSANLNTNVNVVTILSNDNDSERTEVMVEGRQVLGTLSGHITDDGTGAALSNALVRVETGGTNYVAYSGVDGHYSRVVPLGACTVTVARTGYTTPAPTNMALTNDGQSVTLDFALTGNDPQFTLLGKGGNILADNAATQLANGSDFGGALVGLTTVTNTFSITNTGTALLTISGIETNGPQADAFTLTVQTLTIPPSSDSVLTIVFDPKVGGPHQASFVFTHSGTNLPFTANVSGVGYSDSITLEARVLSFSSIYQGANPSSQTVALGNSGAYGFTFTNEVSYSTGANGWLTVLPVDGVVADGDKSFLTNRVDHTGIGAGSYYAIVAVTSGDATNSPQEYVVTLNVRKAPQAINFPNPGIQIVTNETLITATASSGLAVSLEVVIGDAILAGTNSPVALTYTAPGMVSLRATQAGDANWNGAVAVDISFRAKADRIAPCDFDGDGITDLSVYWPEDGNWYIQYNVGGMRLQNWGWSETVPVPGDYDGDSVTDIAVYCPYDSTNNWYILQSSDGKMKSGGPIDWGWSEVVPVPGDYDGDGMTDLAVYWSDGGTNNWYIRQSSDGKMKSGGPINWGWSEVVPVPGDYDGDGMTDVAVYWPDGGTKNWYIKQSSDGKIKSGGPINWGWAPALPVPGDYDGDGLTDIAVYWPEGGNWYIRYSGGGTRQQNWGWSETVPVPGDYDGDGITDIAVYWPEGGNWYILQSSDGQMKTGAPINFGWRAAFPTYESYWLHWF